jgi:hypothetical protein
MDKSTQLQKLIEAANQPYAKLDEVVPLIRHLIKEIQKSKGVAECAAHDIVDREIKEAKKFIKEVAAQIKLKKGEKGDKGDRGSDGNDGKDGKDGEKGDKGDKGLDGSPDTVEKIIDKINDLPTDDESKKIDIAHIKGIKQDKKGVSFVSGPRGIDIYVDGTLKGHSQYINFIAGTNISITHNAVGERNDITISSSGGVGGSFTVLTATGTVDDSNATFTFTDEPQLVVINGAAYAPTGGAITWSYNAGTVTLSSAVGTGGNIYAMK